MATVEITNITPFVQVLNLPAHVVPEASKPGVVGVTRSPTKRVQEGARAVRGGEKIVQARKIRFGGSITLQPAGDPDAKVENLPLSVQQAPDVVSALGASPPRIRLRIVADLTEKDVARIVAAQESAAKNEAALTEQASIRRTKKDRQAGADVGDAKKGTDQ